MREFVYGTDKQYDLLKASLNDNLCHVYRCSLPKSCSKQVCRIGFEKQGKTYALFIDKGITCSRKNNLNFNRWISTGTLKFLDFGSMKDFLRSLKYMY